MEEKRMPMKMTIEELENAMDEESKQIGLTIADLYRTAVTAMLTLPDMSLQTREIHLSVNKDGITIHVGHPRKHGKCDDRKDCEEHDGYDGDEFDEEEGRIYDEL